MLIDSPLRDAHLAEFRRRLPERVARLGWSPERVARLGWSPERLRQEREAGLRAMLAFARARSPWHAARLAGVEALQRHAETGKLKRFIPLPSRRRILIPVMGSSSSETPSTAVITLAAQSAFPAAPSIRIVRHSPLVTPLCKTAPSPEKGSAASNRETALS